jgi:hypothetical protein
MLTPSFPYPTHCIQGKGSWQLLDGGLDVLTIGVQRSYSHSQLTQWALLGEQWMESSNMDCDCSPPDFTHCSSSGMHWLKCKHILWQKYNICRKHSSHWTLLVKTERVSEMLDTNSMLTWLIIQEALTTHSWHESFKSYDFHTLPSALSTMGF